MTDKLASIIPFGKENAISRKAVADALNMSDRDVRELIANATGNGLYIVNDCDGCGYYQPKTLEEKFRYYWREFSRAISILKKLKPLRKELKAAGMKVA